MSSARSGCERPDTSISRFDGPRSSQFCGFGVDCVAGASRPGSGATSVVVTGSVALVGSSGGIAFLVLLPRAGDAERARRDVSRDDRSRANPSTFPNLDRGNEGIVDTGPDVPADRRPAFGLTGLVREVRGDVPRADVHALRDVSVADVGEMRHLGALAHARVLDLHECARLRARLENSAGAKVTERTNEHTRADRGIDGDDVWAYAGAFADDRSAVQHGERADYGVGLDLHRRLDPRRRWVDDRDPREHVHLVDPVAQRRGGLGELDARVHAFGLGRVIGLERDDALT